MGPVVTPATTLPFMVGVPDLIVSGTVEPIPFEEGIFDAFLRIRPHAVPAIRAA